MKKNLKKLAALLLVMVLVCAIAPTAAFAAAGSYEADAVIPVKVTATGIASGADPLQRQAGLAYVFELTSVEAGNPMPDNATLAFDALTEQASSTSIHDYTAEGEFVIHYVHPGVYNYTLTQIVDPDTAAYDMYCEYNTNGVQTYDITVTVYNDPNVDSGLVAAVRVHGQENKPGCCDFVNGYSMMLELNKKWSGANYSRPTDGVNLEVAHGDSVYNYTLSKDDIVSASTWSKAFGIPYDYRDLDSASLGYSVDEKPVPVGYVKSLLDPQVIIKDDVIKGVSFTVVNHHALIQTGQLNWPIPLLVCAGALLIALGVILLSKKRKTDA